MKKRDLIFTICIALIFFGAVIYSLQAANTFPTTENVWEEGDIIEEGWANALENRIGANATTSKTTLTYQVNTLMATTSFPQLSTIGTITTGVWQGTAIGDSYITKTGDWTGTFDGQEGSYYLDFTNLTNTGTSTLPNLSSVGTITTGVWNGTDIAVADGGTGRGTFTAGQLLYGNLTSSLSSVATTSVTCSSPLSCGAFDVLTGGGAITLSTAGDWTGTLDLIEGASFLRSDVADSATGLLTLTGGITVPNASSTQGFDFTGYLLANNASSTISNLKTSTLTVGGNATSSFSGDINLPTGKCFQVNGTCVGGGTGITSLEGQTGATQTFATSSDTNIGLTITSAGNVHTFTSNWIGTLANSRLTNSTISGIALGSNLAALTNDATLNGSSYNGSGAISDWGINLANANTWTALQTFSNASTTQGLDVAGYFMANTASSTLWGGNGTLLFNAASSTISNLKATSLAIDSTGNLTAPTSFGGRSLTVNGTALDADAELYTKSITFKLVSTSTSAMSTSTNYASFQIPVASTLTNASGWCDGAATTSVSMQERTNPEIAGSEIFGGEQVANIFSIGDNSATTTFRDSGIAANSYLVVDLDGYLIGTPTRCFLNIKMTADD